MPEPSREFRFRFEMPQLRRATRVAASAACVGPALPRITRLMALAVKIDALLDQCPDLDGQELARRAQVSRTRITQILNLALLAPDIQEQLLWLPPLASGREAITEKSLRRLSGEPHWERQRERFTELLARRSGAAHSVGAVGRASAPAAPKQFASLKMSEPTRLQSTNLPERERRLACQSL